MALRRHNSRVYACKTSAVERKEFMHEVNTLLSTTNAGKQNKAHANTHARRNRHAAATKKNKHMLLQTYST